MRFTLSDAALGIRIGFFFGPWGKEFLSFAKSKDDIVTEEPKGYSGFCSCDNECEPVIWLPKVPRSSDPQSVGYLAHEISHALDHCFEYYGFDCREVFATLLGYFTEEALTRAAKRGK